jgi:DNA-binding transcriptional ArsR family regulator
MNDGAQSDGPACGPHAVHAPAPPVPDAAFARGAALFKALGDPSRLRVLHHLDHRERCVSDLAEAVGVKLSTLSQQLRVLHVERLVKRRREGKHIHYALADEHVRALLRAALDHAGEARGDRTGDPEETSP